jgi:hypothetical protein
MCEFVCVKVCVGVGGWEGGGECRGRGFQVGRAVGYQSQVFSVQVKPYQPACMLLQPHPEHQPTYSHTVGCLGPPAEAVLPVNSRHTGQHPPVNTGSKKG